MAMRGNVYRSIRSMSYIGGIFFVAFFLPSWFVSYSLSRRPLNHDKNSTFRLGLENISPSLLDQLTAHSARVGLVTNQTGIDQQGILNATRLSAQGINVAVIFVPQKLPKGSHINVLPATIPMVYWDKAKKNNQLEKHLKNIDILMFDMQDSGLRYGHSTTLLSVMEIAAQYQKKVIVLDRPNLLGSAIEGVALHHEYRADDIAVPVPIRHGLTLGELADYFNRFILPTPIDLQIVPMEHYQRDSMKLTSLDLHNVSQHIQSLDSFYGYSFLGLLGEVAPFDVGLGTEKSFQCIALPDKYKISKQTWYELKTVLKEYGIESSLYRYFSKRKKSYCSGLQVRIPAIHDFFSFAAFLSIVRFFKKEGLALTFSEQFDRIVGTSKVRKCLEGLIPSSELELAMHDGLRDFFHKAARSFIYYPAPKVASL